MHAPALRIAGLAPVAAEAEHRPLRILHVFRAPVGGLFRHVRDVAREQAARGHHVGILCDASTGGDVANRLLDELVPSLDLGVMRVPMSRYPDLADLKTFRATSEHFRTAAPDVIHTHGSKGGVYGRMPAFFEGSDRPIRVYTPHGGSFNYRPGTLVHKLYMAAERLMEWRTDLFLFESQYMAERFRTYVGETGALVRVALNGVTEDEFTPISHAPDACDIVYVGELRMAKGVDTLFDALAMMRDQDGRRVSALIVGSGPDEAFLKDLAVSRGLAETVTFTGPAAIRAVLARGRVMVLPSRKESLPYVILEAAAAGQPLISTNVGGIAEIFGPYANRLIPPDDPERLRRVLATMLDKSTSDRDREAAELRAFVNGRFSLKHMVDGVMKAYREALAVRARA
jgi:glycosyltransferase involved in cell wall biosynthesis